MNFRIRDPKTGEAVRQFEVVHQKLFHLFLLSQDLEYFAHVHPDFDEHSRFRLETELPKPGTYWALVDCYPRDGTPQLLFKTFSTAGYMKSLEAGIPRLTPDLAPKKSDNLEVALTLEPSHPVAAQETLLRFHPNPYDGMELYLGAWGHMLAVSDDLMDAIHEHPFVNSEDNTVNMPKWLAIDGIPFKVMFPRATTYRIWVQFQRHGLVNTVAFTIPVSKPEFPNMTQMPRCPK